MLDHKLIILSLTKLEMTLQIFLAFGTQFTPAITGPNHLSGSVVDKKTLQRVHYRSVLLTSLFFLLSTFYFCVSCHFRSHTWTRKFMCNASDIQTPPFHTQKSLSAETGMLCVTRMIFIQEFLSLRTLLLIWAEGKWYNDRISIKKTVLKDLLSQPLTASEEQKIMTDQLYIPTYWAQNLSWGSSSMSVW